MRFKLVIFGGCLRVSGIEVGGQPCEIRTLENFQVFEPNEFSNGMIDWGTLEWKYCFITRVDECLEWCVENMDNGCVGLSTHEAQESLVFPVNSIETREDVQGMTIWYYPCLVGGEITTVPSTLAEVTTEVDSDASS